MRNASALHTTYNARNRKHEPVAALSQGSFVAKLSRISNESQHQKQGTGQARASQAGGAAITMRCVTCQARGIVAQKACSQSDAQPYPFLFCTTPTQRGGKPILSPPSATLVVWVTNTTQDGTIPLPDP